MFLLSFNIESSPLAKPGNHVALFQLCNSTTLPRREDDNASCRIMRSALLAAGGEEASGEASPKAELRNMQTQQETLGTAR